MTQSAWWPTLLHHGPPSSCGPDQPQGSSEARTRQPSRRLIGPTRSSPRRSISPVCSPARISKPRGAIASEIACAHLTPRAGPSKVASTPSPVCLISAPGSGRASSSRRCGLSYSRRARPSTTGTDAPMSSRGTGRREMARAAVSPRRRTDVSVEEPPRLGDQRARCHRRPLVTGVPIKLAFTPVPALRPCSCAKPRVDRVEDPIPLLDGVQPRRFASALIRDPGVAQDQAGRSFRMGRREQGRHNSTLGRGEDRGALGTHSVHHHDQVVGERFKWRHIGRRESIGTPPATAVSDDDPCTLRETPQETR